MPFQGRVVATIAIILCLVFMAMAEVEPKVLSSNITSLSTQEIEEQLQVRLALTSPYAPD